MHYNIKFTNMHETQEKANTQKQKGLNTQHSL